MLLRLKFAGRRQLAPPLGRWLGRALAAQTAWPVAAVVPLPMHRQKESLRGYNQAELIARGAARELGLPLVRLLKKTRHTSSQTGLSLVERKTNVTGAFTVCRALPPRWAVLLVDDIYSTGATMREAALALQRSGLVVYGAVVAYNPRLD
jgi:predicted amidophosphoribosyltransferase